MHDTLEYMQMEPYLRSPSSNKLSFSMWYFQSERFLLPLSHDEVVHGKATILQKMNGAYEAKFPQAKVLYTYMYLHPGKKLNFMGNEIGQFREWSEKEQEDWETGLDAALKELTEQAGGGSMAQVEAAGSRMDYYRTRANAVLRALYSYDPDFTYAYDSAGSGVVSAAG